LLNFFKIRRKREQPIIIFSKISWFFLILMNLLSEKSTKNKKRGCGTNYLKIWLSSIIPYFSCISTRFLLILKSYISIYISTTVAVLGITIVIVLLPKATFSWPLFNILLFCLRNWRIVGQDLVLWNAISGILVPVYECILAQLY